MIVVKFIKICVSAIFCSEREIQIYKNFIIRKKNYQNPKFHINKIRKKTNCFLWKNAQQRSLSGFKKKDRKQNVCSY